MTARSDRSVTLRELIEERYSDLKFRKIVLEASLLDTPLADAMLNRQDFLRRIMRLPGAGIKTAESLSYIFWQETEHLLASARQPDAAPLPASLEQLLRDGADTEGLAHVTFSSLAGSFVTGSMDGNDKHPFWALGNAFGKTAFYLPNTLPDFFKTEAVWQAERHDFRINQKYRANLKKVSDLASEAQISVRFVIDETVWNDLVTRRGKYRSLTEAQVAEQVGILRSAGVGFGGQMSFETANYPAAGLSNCLVVEHQFISTYVFGGYYITKDPRMVSHVYRSLLRARKTPIFP